MTEKEVRLIDANALISELSKGTIVPDDLYARGIMSGVYSAMKTVQKMPSIDHESLRPRGKWIGETCNHKPCRIKNPEKWLTYHCSVCGYSNGRKKSNYCPNCGAIMKEEG